jgi:hypothetical protein
MLNKKSALISFRPLLTQQKPYPMKTTRIFALACTMVALFTASVQAQTYIFSVNLSGPNESPANASPGTGFATVTFDTISNLMSVDLTFSGLTGNTTASHIHGATAVAGAGTAGVATVTPTFTGFPLGVTSGTYNHTFDMTLTSSYNAAFVTANGGTVSTAEAALLSAMLAGKTYLNIHTTTFGGGEIRGFLTPVPEPSTLALLGVGGLLLVRGVRRR